MRSSGSIVSTVATKFANGPDNSSILSPSFKLLGGKSLPEVSHLAINPETSCNGSGFGLLPKLTSRETPIVLLIWRHGASLALTFINIYPGNKGFKSLTKREAFLRVTGCMGRKVSNPWRLRLRSASRWLFGLNCIKYHCFIMPASFWMTIVEQV